MKNKAIALTTNDKDEEDTSSIFIVGCWLLYKKNNYYLSTNDKDEEDT